MLTLRIRSVMWFAAGLAIAIALVWSFTAWRASAIGPNESTFVPVTPVRILDSRDPTNVGLAGPFVSALPQDLQVTGSIPTTTGNQIVVPAGATGVQLNVTAVSPTANGFISIRPADAPGAPTTSSLNVVAGEILPNAVAVSLPTAGADAGKIEITFDAYGTAGPTTDILIDVVGYNINTGLQDLETRLVAIETGPITMSQGPGSWTNNGISGVPAFSQASPGLTITAGGFVNLALTGPINTSASEPYTLREVEYCVRARTAPAVIDTAYVIGYSGIDSDLSSDATVRNAAGCYVFTPSQLTRAHDGFMLLLSTSGGGSLTIGTVTSTWAPRSVLGVTATAIADTSAEEVPELAGT